MKDIICPHCGTAFHVDESTYQTIVSQVRNHMFEEELESRARSIAEQYKSREETERLRAEKEFEAQLMKSKHDYEAKLVKSERDYEAQLASREKSVTELAGEVSRLKSALETYESRKDADLKALEARKSMELSEALVERDKRITELEQAAATRDAEHKMELLQVENNARSSLQEREHEVSVLKAELNNERLSAENRENQLREHHKLQLEDKQAEIERLRDFKLRQSTKMVGETLEQHCYTLFAQAQSMGLYPDAYFDKDNTVVDGTKGDFVFRDYIEGHEYVSVMFEMKNEVDTTATKHRNDDFLDKLDKDRTKKGCEYAVLVSMLEQGNELYDAGIVDKSHRYPKMLVIRPQFFMPVLRIITEGSRKGYMEKQSVIRELEQARNESLDLSRFQDKLDKVKSALNSNYEAAHKKFVMATEGIDKAIEALEKQIVNLRKIKSNFESSEQKLLKAAQLGEEDLTIRKLTYGNPTVRKMMDEADKS
ncbi:MAG: DUF2130 domain-containing protein [Muribaculaceae bacterium]|nr:DUF2130 domain-containing protein [Muribaculaceae bacterium]